MMRWGYFIIGLLVLLIGLRSYFSGWGVPIAIVDVLPKIPTFGLNMWIFVGAGIILLYFSFRR